MIAGVLFFWWQFFYYDRLIWWIKICYMFVFSVTKLIYFIKLNTYKNYNITFNKYKINQSKTGMCYSYLHWSLLHMGGENSRFVLPSLLFSHAKMRFTWFLGFLLGSNWRRGIISLIQLPTPMLISISWTFRNRPVRTVIILIACSTDVLWVIWSWAYNFRGRV